MTDRVWRPVSAVPALTPEEVQVWRFRLEGNNHAEDRTLLSCDECVRADAFHFERDRLRYVAGRAELRRFLAAHLGRDPAELRFEYGPAGKPSLLRMPGVPDVRFNLSHSQDVGLFACTLGIEVGVDVEHRRDADDLLELAERFFSPAEAQELRDAPIGQQLAVFYACWTRKEACLKAVGSGLQQALDSFSIGGAALEQPTRIAVVTPAGSHDLLVYPAPPIAGCDAALATCGPRELRPRFLEWKRGCESS